MKGQSSDETSIIEEQLDRLIRKGIQLSKGLSVDERNYQIKRVIDDCLDRAIGNLKIAQPGNFSESELLHREQKLRAFVKDYYEKRMRTV